MSDLESEIRRLVGEGSISDREAIRLILASQAEIMAAIGKISDDIIARRLVIDERLALMERRVQATEDYQRQFPSITWLLRHRTKETVVFIVAIFMALSLWFVSGFRHPILDWLGLPIF